jgi:outer membrane protein OmpA-like peptidoglycan-associated protein
MGTFDTPNRKGKITFDQDLEIKLVTKYYENYVLQNVSFKTGSSELTPESYPACDELIARLLKTPQSYVEIAGHSDNQGDPQKNMALSQARANSVRDYLISKGIPKNQIYSKGYGQRLPIYPNENEEGRRKNRRIEVRFVEII